MNGERQMLPVHTIRIRASSPMTEIPSGHVRGLGNERGLHGLILAFAPGPACSAQDPGWLGSVGVGDDPRCGQRGYAGSRTALTLTGMPLRTDVPESGSNASGSVSRLVLTPGWAAATDPRVPGRE